MKQRKLAFILPRFSEQSAGGDQTLVGSLAERVAARGAEVTILTTCAVDNRTWENVLPAGETVERGLKVIRFPVDERDLESWIPRQVKIAAGETLSIDDELVWMENSVCSAGLFSHIDEHAEEYDWLCFAPYLFGTTFWGSLIRPERSLLIPCLHDEPYAYTSVVKSMFRQTAGCIFNSEAERLLAKRLYGEVRGGSVGMGFEPLLVEDAPPYFKDDEPYLLYIGRKETGKNAHLLVDHFIAAKEKKLFPAEAKLAIAGGGDFKDVERPEALSRGDVVDVPFLSEQEKRSLIANASALVQPSTNESFSIVLMEAWLLGTPVLVNGECEVTSDHVSQSQGGFTFQDQHEFAERASILLADRERSALMAEAGKRYVHREYSWPVVLDRLERVLGRIELSESEEGHPVSV